MSTILYTPRRKSITLVSFGLLYNPYAATDARNICAAGWRVGISSDFSALWSFVTGSVNGGGKLKETGLTYWVEPNTGATNEYGFNARGAGIRQADGTFFDLRGALVLMDGDYPLNIINEVFSSSTGSWAWSKSNVSGSSIRLINTSTTLTHGQTGTYTGNDGKIYRTICIGTQEWLADNLAETKYRNGDSIPEVTDNSAWAALTTGALCVYNNDWSNV